MISWFINFLLKSPNSPIKNAVRNIFYGEVISERIVEYSLMYTYLGLEPSSRVKILDIGCYYSNFPIQLASMGYAVTAIDLMGYELTHPNFTFLKADINTVKLPKNHFDIVTCISTLEHIGIGFYENDPKDVSADHKTVQVIRSVLEKDGKFLLTVPFGKKSVNSVQRVYDWESLEAVLEGFRIQRALFYKEQKGKWLPATQKEASKIQSKHKTRAIAFIQAVKK